MIINKKALLGLFYLNLTSMFYSLQFELIKLITMFAIIGYSYFFLYKFNLKLIS